MRRMRADAERLLAQYPPLLAELERLRSRGASITAEDYLSTYVLSCSGRGATPAQGCNPAQAAPPAGGGYDAVRKTSETSAEPSQTHTMVAAHSRSVGNPNHDTAIKPADVAPASIPAAGSALSDQDVNPLWKAISSLDHRDITSFLKRTLPPPRRTVSLALETESEPPYFELPPEDECTHDCAGAHNVYRDDYHEFSIGLSRDAINTYILNFVGRLPLERRVFRYQPREEGGLQPPRWARLQHVRLEASGNVVARIELEWYADNMLLLAGYVDKIVLEYTTRPYWNTRLGERRGAENKDLRLRWGTGPVELSEILLDDQPANATQRLVIEMLLDLSGFDDILDGLGLGTIVDARAPSWDDLPNDLSDLGIEIAVPAVVRSAEISILGMYAELRGTFEGFFPSSETSAEPIDYSSTPSWDRPAWYARVTHGGLAKILWHAWGRYGGPAIREGVSLVATQVLGDYSLLLVFARGDWTLRVTVVPLYSDAHVTEFAAVYLSATVHYCVWVFCGSTTFEGDVSGIWQMVSRWFHVGEAIRELISPVRLPGVDAVIQRIDFLRMNSVVITGFLIYEPLPITYSVGDGPNVFLRGMGSVAHGRGFVAVGEVTRSLASLGGEDLVGIALAGIVQRISSWIATASDDGDTDAARWLTYAGHLLLVEEDASWISASWLEGVSVWNESWRTSYALDGAALEVDVWTYKYGSHARCVLESFSWHPLSPPGSATDVDLLVEDLLLLGANDAVPVDGTDWGGPGKEARDFYARQGAVRYGRLKSRAYAFPADIPLAPSLEYHPSSVQEIVCDVEISDDLGNRMVVTETDHLWFQKNVLVDVFPDDWEAVRDALVVLARREFYERLEGKPSGLAAGLREGPPPAMRPPGTVAQSAGATSPIADARGGRVRDIAAVVQEVLRSRVR